MIAAIVLTAQILLTPCTLDGVSGPTRCGTYRVWENRETKRGRQIDLSIIVLEALSTPRKRESLFLLAGGPGDAPSFNASFFSRVFAGVRQTRDLVLVDLRGTGKSNPLTCPELTRPNPEGSLDENILSVTAVQSCLARLEKTADLRQYTTEIAVDDLDEVRAALGYNQINLYGTSYGSRVAQVYMRRYPSSLRTVSMKGIVPPSLASPETHARAGEEAWRRLVKRCQSNELCARNFPTPDADLRTLLKRLEPATVLAMPGSQNATTKIRVTSGLFAEVFRFFLYSPENEVRGLKLLRDIVHDEKPGLIENVLGGRAILGGERLAAGFFLSVSCTEDVPYLPKEIAPLVDGTFGGDYRLRQQLNACAIWPSGKVSGQHRKPTKSAIPTLILSGEFDPVTPPSGGEEVLRGLTRGLHVVIKNNGHPIGSAEQCIGNLIGAFVDKGSVIGLDYSCASKIPEVQFQ